MDDFNVNLSEPAEHDLRDIARYISSQLNAPMNAIRMIREIRQSVAGLESNAVLYPLVRDDRLSALGYRSLRIKSYVAFYRADEKQKTVVVDRILYSRRDWANFL